jgi:hypothetical protein
MRWLLVTMTLAGCITYDQPVDPTDPTGGGDPTGSGSGPGTPRTARQAFDQTVYTILDTKCGFCHDESSPVLPFVDSDPTGAYDYIKAVPSILGTPLYSNNATLLTSPDPTDPYTAAQLATIEDWLSLERGGGN